MFVLKKMPALALSAIFFASTSPVVFSGVTACAFLSEDAKTDRQASTHKGTGPMDASVSLQHFNGCLDHYTLLDDKEKASLLNYAGSLLKRYKSLADEKQKNLLMEKSIKLVKKIADNFSFPPHKNITLFLSETGGGKSTTINYLAGSQISVAYRNARIVLDTLSTPSDMKVCHGFQSCTLFPRPYEDKENGLVYFDCPGLGDTRGILYEFINALLIQRVIREAERVNFAILVTERSLSDRTSIKELHGTISALQSYAEDFEKFKDAFLLIITKGTYLKVGDTLRDDVEFIQSSIQGNGEDKGLLEEGSLSPYARKFLSHMVSSQGEDLQKKHSFVFSFKQPTGEMVGKNIGPEEREKMITALQNLQLVEKQKDFHIQLSAEAKNRVADFIVPLNKGVERIIKSLWSDFQQFFLSSLGGSQSWAHIVSSLEDIHASWHSIAQESTGEGETLKTLYDKLRTRSASLGLGAAKENLSEILKQEEILTLFKKVSHDAESLIEIPALWTQGLVDVQEKIHRLINWYRLLGGMFDILSGPFVQLERDTYKRKYAPTTCQRADSFTLTCRGQSSAQDGGGLVISRRTFNEFLKKFSGFHGDELATRNLGNMVKELASDPFFSSVEDFSSTDQDNRLGDLKIVELNQLIERCLLNEARFVAHNNTLIVQGNFLRSSDIASAIDAHDGPLSAVRIYGEDTIFFDQDLRGQNLSGASLAILAPKWHMIGSRRIVLDGKQGGGGEGALDQFSHSGDLAAGERAYGANGKNGMPGGPGENGGHFLGEGDTFVSSETLSISVMGGRGGAGQRGGNGADGVKGKNASLNVTVTKRTDFNDLCDEIRGAPTTVCYKFGEAGEAGGTAGMGGLGGLGGLSGRVMTSSHGKWEVIEGKGPRGKDGEAGAPGKGGFFGNTAKRPFWGNDIHTIMESLGATPIFGIDPEEFPQVLGALAGGGFVGGPAGVAFGMASLALGKLEAEMVGRIPEDQRAQLRKWLEEGVSLSRERLGLQKADMDAEKESVEEWTDGLGNVISLRTLLETLAGQRLLKSILVGVSAVGGEYAGKKFVENFVIKKWRGLEELEPSMRRGPSGRQPQGKNEAHIQSPVERPFMDASLIIEDYLNANTHIRHDNKFLSQKLLTFYQRLSALLAYQKSHQGF